jgi:CubicO group peptidase (beta-lactamase class C family)
VAAASAALAWPRAPAPPTTQEQVPLAHARPEEIGLDSRRLQAAYDLLDGWTAGTNAPVPGGAILIGRHGRVVAPQFFGRQGPQRGAPPLRTDGLFLMASVTKPIVYLAGMMLVERGRLNLNDPVIRYVPEFARNGKEGVRVVHLFTHTSGLPDITG